MHNHIIHGGIRGKVEAFGLCSNPFDGNPDAAGGAETKRLSAFRLHRWTTWGEGSATHGSSRWIGFSVMRSPDRSLVKRGHKDRKTSLLTGLVRCPDAMAPGSKEAERTRTGLA